MKLTVLPTVHSLLEVYSPEKLCSYLEDIAPDVIFQEVPESQTAEFCKNKNEKQEDLAVNLYTAHNPTPLIPVDLPCLNQDAYYLKLFDHEKFMNALIWEKDFALSHKMQSIVDSIKALWAISDKKAIDSGYSWLSSKGFEELSFKIYSQEQELLTEYDKIHGTNHLQNYIGSYTFHFDIREKAIAIRCLQEMQSYKNGVLLIGASHFGIINVLKQLAVNEDLIIERYKERKKNEHINSFDQFDIR